MSYRIRNFRSRNRTACISGSLYLYAVIPPVFCYGKDHNRALWDLRFQTDPAPRVAQRKLDLLGDWKLTGWWRHLARQFCPDNTSWIISSVPCIAVVRKRYCGDDFSMNLIYTAGMAPYRVDHGRIGYEDSRTMPYTGRSTCPYG